MKSTYEIVIYKEFLKELKEYLASIEIFPSKFNEININYEHIYTPVFNDFSLESNKLLEICELPENVKLTKRVYPYLRNNSYYKGRQGEELYKLLINDITQKEDYPIDIAYKKAESKLNEGYISYCNNEFLESSNLISGSIPLWVEYLKLVESDTNRIGYMSGMLSLMSGSAAADGGNLNQAMNTFINAAKYFHATESYKEYVAIAQCFMADIFYKQGDIAEFIEWMELSKKNGLNNILNKTNYVYAFNAAVTKALVITYEYNRIKDPINTPQTHAEFKNDINALLRFHMGNDDLTVENRYNKKFLKNYNSIMASNSMFLNSISFYSNSETHPAKTSDYVSIELKDHYKPTEIIKPPHWTMVLIDNQYVFNTKQTAVIKNMKMIIKANFFNFNNEPITNIAKIIGQTDNGLTFESKFNNFTISPGNNEIDLISNIAIEDKVFILNLAINWYVLTKDNIKINLTATNEHKIYVVRTKPAQPCYWQIVEYTCNWMKDLSPSQLTEDRNVIDAIWKGCSIENLNKLGYRYQFPMPVGEEGDQLHNLLQKKYGKCGTWATFLRHCFYCQGIKNVNTAGYGGDHINFSFIEAALGTNDAQVCIFKDDKTAIGNISPMYFKDHALVGYGGRLIYQDQFGDIYDGGELFDIVFHEHMQNNTPEIYENTMVKRIKANEFTDEYHEQDPNKKEFLLRRLLVPNSAPEKDNF